MSDWVTKSPCYVSISNFLYFLIFPAAAPTVDHAKLTNWQQQPVNVFLSSKRPPCVEELHQEAELNLQTLLQGDCFAEEFEDRYLDTKVTGQTFHYSALSQSATLAPETPTKSNLRRLEFVYLPSNRRVSEDESTTVGVRPRETCLSLPTTPDKQVAWIKAFPFPIPEERRWHQSNSIQTNIVPINVSGELFDKHASSHHSLFNTETAVNPKTTLRRRRTIIGFSHHQSQDQGEGKRSAASESTPKKSTPGNVNGVTTSEQPPAPPDSPPAKSESSHGRHPGGRAATPHPQQLPLRKTFSDLGHILQPSNNMDSASMIYSNPPCNGAKDCATSNWQANSFNYMTSSSPLKIEHAPVAEPAKSLTMTMASPGVCKGTGSFKIKKENLTRGHSGSICLSTTLPGHGMDPPKVEKYKVVSCPSQQLGGSSLNNSSTLPTARNECTFRERSLSMPTDTGSLSSVDITYAENRRGSGDYALNYPSGSSEESTSTENVSAVVDQDNQERRRSRSISLRKPKKKPSPPARSVSLIKDASAQKLQPASTMPKDQRPKSLCIAFDSQGNSYIPTSMQGNATMPSSKSMLFTQNWNSSDCKSNDLHRTLTSSSSVTGLTVIESRKIQGSSESLTSLYNSRATTPSQTCTEVDSKLSSPGKPPGLMSPSSGYSSQSETPTTFSTSLILGHSPYQSQRVRPMVPERKSSLPAVSPIDRSPSVRQSFDLPLTPPTHLDLTSGRNSSRNKVRTSKSHSDSTFSTKNQNQKTSPVQPVMPMVTQSDLRNIRLRSISRSETEDNLDIVDHLDELTDEAFPLPEKKTKPPVAEKPPMSRRPNSLSYRTSAAMPESPVMSPSSPGKYLRDQVSPQDAYMVIGTMRHKKNYDYEMRMETPPSLDPSPPPESYFQTNQPSARSFSQSSADEDDYYRGRQFPDRITLHNLSYIDKKKVKVPPPIPKKPSVLHLPVASPPPGQMTPSSSEQRLSPIVTSDYGACAYPDIIEFQKYSAEGSIHGAQPDLVSMDAYSGSYANMPEDGKCVSRKTAECITEDDDEVFVSSRTTEDLFTLIHRSKRKLLGWKDSGDSFGSRQSSMSPIKISYATNSDTGTLSISRTSSKTEDFKALLQRKGSKSSIGARPSAAELLKTTNPLARRVMSEFAPEFEKNGNTKTLPRD
ncbi:PREDICTED: NHS-like protein 2 [Nanorana parkeri]|uniref:NHS-like protein 2 n=1 Tax=Nanorana parkeri TaxID=125878 RepID=UPI0008540BE0|nr:PREDICTED: NHS-like protein 2 [Nanorana parkeri]